MKRRPALMLPVAMLVAWIIALYISKQAGAIISLTVLTVILSILSFLFACYLYRKEHSFIYMAVPLTFIICLLRFTLYDIKLDRWMSDSSLQRIQEEGATGKVSRVELKNESTYIYLDAKLDKETVGVLLLISDEQDYRPGMELYFKGKGSLLPEPTNPGQFDSKSYYLSKGVAYRFIDPEIRLIKKEGFLNAMLCNIKEWLRLSIDKNAYPEDAGVFKAMLLGDKGDVSEEIKGLYQAGGISHILAISGLHVTFIGYMIFGLFRLLGLRLVGSSILASSFTIIYAVMVGAPVSAIRAVIMLVISLTATALGRTYDMCSALSLSWLIVVLIYPMQLTQSGFQLSFGAIIAFAFIVPELSELLGYLKKRRFRGKPKKSTVYINKLENSIIGSAVVSSVTWPVIAWHMYVITPISIAYNVIVIPFMSLIMMNLIVASVVGIFSVAGILPVMRIIWIPAHYILKLYRMVCELTPKLKFGQVVVGRPMIISLAIYVLFAVAIVAGVHLLNRRLERKREIADFKGEKWDERRKVLKAVLRVIIVILTITIQLVGLAVLKRPKQDNCIVFADVGQGDGALYFSGDTCICIDGESSFLEGIGTYRLEPIMLYMGYQEVDEWFLSHPDKDHVSGLIDILEDKTSPIRVRSIAIPKASFGREWENIVSRCDGITVNQVSEGDGLKWEGGEIDVLYPREDDSADNVNDLCMVFTLSTDKTRLLFCGDISETIEKKIVDRYTGTNRLKVDILKVGHHGSKYSSSEEFLEELSAKIAIISVGKNNYGHPSKEALERLSAAEMMIFTTLENGALVRYI